MQSKVLSGVEEYIKKTPKSLEFSKSSKKVMPGGVTANIKFFEPYPIVMKSGSGAYLTDVDGNEYNDFLLSYGALLTGHGHLKIIEAIQNQNVYTFEQAHIVISPKYPINLHWLRFSNL